MQQLEAKHFIAKLVMLNRLENDSMLLHDKLGRQEWGNAAMFTEEQHRAVEMARSAFKEGKPLHLLGNYMSLFFPPALDDVCVLYNHEN